MSRFTDYLAKLGGSTTEEEPSAIDTVKGLLKGAALTTVAGAFGGNAGMQALGGFAQARANTRKQRRLDEIARVKDQLAAERDIAAIQASEANIAEGKERIDLAKKEAFDRAIERTQREQAGMRELKFKSEQDALDRELKREELGVKKSDAVAKAKAKIAGDQERQAKQGIGKITGAMSQFPINPADEEKAAEAAAGIAQAFRENLGTKTADQAEKNFDTLLSTGQIKIDARLEPEVRRRVVEVFKAEEEYVRGQNRTRAGFPATGPMPEPNAGFLNTVEQGQYVPIIGDAMGQAVKQHSVGLSRYPRGGSR